MKTRHINTTAIGRTAEAVAAAFLEAHGFTVLGRNWRTRYCEIDIVARRSQTVCFWEVKYRKSSSQGTGAEYVTPRKLHQMAFAAKLWLACAQWTGDYRLGVIEVSGGEYRITQATLDVL